MAQITTTNSLDDFDMCLAVAQAAIDSVMEDAWEAWKERNFKDTIEIFKIKRNGEIVNSQYGLSAQIDPLQVSLAVPDGKLGQVKVTLPVKSGRVVYYDEATEQKAEQQIANWSISFVTDLDKKPVDLKALAQIDPGAHDKAQEVIRNTGLDEGVFSVEYLFLKLTQVDLLLSDNKHIQIPGDVPSSARTKALSCLNMLLQGELGEYILGTVVRRNTKQATPTFALTDFIFNVRANWDKGWASTLEYLGEFSGRGLPPVLNEARLKLADFWVRPEQLDGSEANVSGIMAISKDIIMNKYLVPAFAQQLGVHPQQQGTKWTFAQQNSPVPQEVHDILKRIFTQSGGYTITLATNASTETISIAGEINGNLHYDVYTWLDQNNHTEWVYAHGTQKLEGELTFSGSGIGVGFSLPAALRYSFGDISLATDDIGGFAKVEDALGILDWKVWQHDGREKSIKEVISDIVSGLVNMIKSALDNALSRVSVALQQTAFIPPGGGVFTFQNPRFSNAGDLVLEVLYRQP